MSVDLKDYLVTEVVVSSTVKKSDGDYGSAGSFVSWKVVHKEGLSIGVEEAARVTLDLQHRLKKEMVLFEVAEKIKSSNSIKKDWASLEKARELLSQFDSVDARYNALRELLKDE